MSRICDRIELKLCRKSCLLEKSLNRFATAFMDTRIQKRLIVFCLAEWLAKLERTGYRC